ARAGTAWRLHALGYLRSAERGRSVSVEAQLATSCSRCHGAGHYPTRAGVLRCTCAAGRITPTRRMKGGRLHQEGEHRRSRPARRSPSGEDLGGAKDEIALDVGSGGRIRTDDLRVMGPTSDQAALPRNKASDEGTKGGPR